jgi:hypothetical protein
MKINECIDSFLRKKNMKSKHEFKLIDGTFKPIDASKILMGIIFHKINHHNLEILSTIEHHNGDTSHSAKRIKELEETSKALRKVLDKAAKNGQSVSIKGTINLILSEE